MIAIASFAWGAERPESPVSVIFLRCGYLVNPLGVQTQRPRLSWVLQSPERGQRQTAYRVLVSSSPELLAKDQGDLWDSGRVSSDRTVQVTYAGKPLGSRTQAFWKVRVWDREGRPSPFSPPATWTMGLLEPSDWKAQWIEAPVKPVPPIPGRNGHHSAWARSADTTKWVAVDLGEPRTIDSLVFFPARPWDWPDTPGFLFPLRFRIEVADAPDFQHGRIVVDQTAHDVHNPGAKSVRYGIAPVRARYVRLVVTRLPHVTPGKFAFALAQWEILGEKQNWALGRPVTASDEVGGSWSRASLVDGIRTARRPEPGKRQPSPMLRKAFSLAGPVKRALVRASALGLYELRLNGRVVGQNVLAPEWTDYHTRVQYQTYDVAPLLQRGQNVVAAVLGDGWYAGRIGLAGIVPNGRPWAIYGDNPKLIVQLEIDMADGSRRTIESDASWKATMEGPIRFNDILDGEIDDARRAMPGWDRPGFNDDAWQPVRVITPITRRSRSQSTKSEVRNPKQTQSSKYQCPKRIVPDKGVASVLPGVPLVAQPNEPIRVVKELKPVKLTQPKPGVWIFDLGQNMVGRCRFRARAPAGTTATLRYGEAINPDGTLYTANLRGAKQIDQFTFRGDGPEVFEPLFTYHGFRYVEVTGVPGKLTPECLLGRVFCSSSPEVGRFACSDPQLTRLMENIVWTQRANLMSVPTDCPQRDERLGWMGDIQAFSQTACFNMDMAGFFTKWVQDIRDAQARDGRFPDFAPHPFGPNERFSGVPAWGDAGVVVPWRMYENYADTRMLQEHFDSARRWIEYIRQRNPDLIWKNGRNNDYNDWLNGDTLKLSNWPKHGGAVPNEVFATAFFAHSTDLVAKMASVIGRRDDAERYAQLARQIRRAFCRAFVRPDGRIQGDTQAGYALALYFDLLPHNQRPAALRRLLGAIDRYGGRLSTGIQSTHRLMLQLARSGKFDLAYRLLESHRMPSWLYSLDQGATTIWERWDGYVAGRGFQDPGMNSMNHWAFGSVGEWMWRNIVGLSPDDEHPGYQHSYLRPRPGGGLTWAEGRYDSVRGPIASQWRIEGGRFTLCVTIPPNTTATVAVPAHDPAAVTESGKPAGNANGVKFLRMDGGSAIFAVESGSYLFAAPGP